MQKAVTTKVDLKRAYRCAHQVMKGNAGYPYREDDTHRIVIRLNMRAGDTRYDDIAARWIDAFYQIGIDITVAQFQSTQGYTSLSDLVYAI